MCCFISVGVSGTGISILEAHGRERYGLGVERCSNPSVSALFPPGDALYFLTHGQCSCDLLVREQHLDADEEDRHRLKYRQKGWSDAKIERALAASRASKGSDRSSISEPILKFMEALQQQVDLCGRVRIHAHEYRGAVQEEDVPPSATMRMSMDAFRAARGAFPTDLVIEVVKDAG